LLQLWLLLLLVVLLLLVLVVEQGWLVYPVVVLVVNILDSDAVDGHIKRLFLREINLLNVQSGLSRFVIQWSIENQVIWVIFHSIRLT
jgi:hypothetical protein